METNVQECNSVKVCVRSNKKRERREREKREIQKGEERRRRGKRRRGEEREERWRVRRDTTHEQLVGDSVFAHRQTNNNTLVVALNSKDINKWHSCPGSDQEEEEGSGADNDTE